MQCSRSSENPERKCWEFSIRFPQSNLRPHLPGQHTPYAPPGDGTDWFAKIRFHDLRHTYATLAMQNGMDIEMVSGMLGHCSAGFTLEIYAHATATAQTQAANGIGNVLAI